MRPQPSATPAAPRYFRDQTGLDGLSRALLKHRERLVGGEPFRVWAPFEFSGDDAYSAAIVILEALRRTGDKRALRLFGTSRHADVVRRAREACYLKTLAWQVPGGRLRRYFRRCGDSYGARAGLRERCHFGVHDLSADMPFILLDAIICSVPVHHWQEAARQALLERFWFCLKPGGLLLLRRPLPRRAAGLFDRVPDHTRLYARPAAQVPALPRPAAESRDEFVATVSHELRTPLTAILGYVEALRAGVRAPHRSREFLAAVDRNARRLLQTVDGLVGIAGGKTASRQPRVVDVSAAAAAAADMLRSQARRAGVRLTVQPASEALAVADPSDLPHIFENLIANAVKYNRKGGSVTVTVERRPKAVSVSVADDGLGIPPDALPRVFDRFFRAHDGARTEGAGLGLSIVRRLVEANEGRVAARSLEGVGSTFVVELPGA